MPTKTDKLLRTKVEDLAEETVYAKTTGSPYTILNVTRPFVLYVRGIINMHTTPQKMLTIRRAITFDGEEHLSQLR